MGNFLSVTPLSDGRILASGISQDRSSFRSTFLLVRYQSNGTLDTSLNGSGMVTTSLSGLDRANGWEMALQSNVLTAAVPGYERTGFIDIDRQAGDGIVVATRLHRAPLRWG